MAKTRAPLLSFGARGSVAKTAVYSSWRGVNYVREHVIPANPRTTLQQQTRTTFAALRELWKIAPAIARSPWDTYARGRQFTGMNAYIGENMRVVRQQPDMADFIGSPGALGGFPASDIVITQGSAAGEIDIAATLPPALAGWTVTALQACAFLDFLPSDRVDGRMVAGEETTAPTSLTITVDENAESYVVAAWLQWEKPNGDTAYGVGVTDVVLSGA